MYRSRRILGSRNLRGRRTHAGFPGCCLTTGVGGRPPEAR